MDERFTIEAYDDLFDFDETIDPAQQAMHGLLLTYFEAQSDRPHPRSATILAKIRADHLRHHDRRSWLKLRPWPIGLAAAAVLVFAFLLMVPGRDGGKALALDLREFGYLPGLPDWGFYDDDPETFQEAEVYIARVRAQRDEMISAGKVTEAMIDWAYLSRHLRSLGRWDEALREMHAACEYGRSHQERRKAEGFGGEAMYYVCLTDLGNTYTLLGDFDLAYSYHEQSFDLAEEYVRWAHSPGGTAVDKSSYGLAQALAGTLVPRYWAFSAVAIEQGDYAAAWNYHMQAEALLEDWLKHETFAHNVYVPEGASLFERCRAILPFRNPSIEPSIVKVREHLLRTARLLRLQRELAGAEQALTEGRSIPYNAENDESRLIFSEPMEALRIAIARGDFASALSRAAEADRNSGMVFFEVDRGIPRPRPHPLALTELLYLRAVAEAGLSEDDPDRLTTALDLITETLARLPSEQSLTGDEVDPYLYSKLSAWRDEVLTWQNRLKEREAT
jgi:tetratricopeptide (TPR) repeat protein